MHKKILHLKIIDYLPNKKYIIGAACLSLIFSFVFYYFIIFLITKAIYFSIPFHRDSLIINPHEWNFYKYIIAIFASVISLGFFIRSIFYHPKKFKNHGRDIRLRIRVDQSFYPLNFTFWLSKLILFIAVFRILMGGELNIYKNYRYILILALVVLYFQLWQNIFKFFKNKTYLYFFIFGSLVMLNAYFLVQFDTFNRKKMFFILNKNFPAIKYHPIYPESTFFQKKYKNGLIYRVDIVPMINDSINIIAFKKEQLSYAMLKKFILELKDNLREEEKPFLTINLAIDKDVKMKYVKNVHALLKELNIFRLIYSVRHNDKEYFFKYKLHQQNMETTRRLANVFINSKNEYGIRDSLQKLPNWHVSNLSENLKKLYLYDLNRHSICNLPKGVYIKSHPDAQFGAYLKIISSIFEIAKGYREAYALKKYHKNFDQLPDSIKIIIKHKYPIRVGPTGYRPQLYNFTTFN